MTVFSTTTAPWVLRSVGLYDELLSQIKSGAMKAIQLVELDGGSMQVAADFYNEVSSKLKLPDYFGRNLNALDECVTDLEWVDGNSAVVIVVRNADLMLKGERDLFEGFVDVMTSAGEEWANPIQDGNEWDRPAVPFHMVLHFESANVVVSDVAVLPTV